MHFSVLLSVYHKEKSDYLDEALRSIANQSRKPDEIVLVEDGKLTEELYAQIDSWQERLGSVLRIVKLDENVGLGEALNLGLDVCQYDWVARMDTDDIALPSRFEKQLDFIQRQPDIDILGSWICEFESDPDKCDQIRKVPSAHQEIAHFAKYRNPLNHMTVIFKKEAVLDAGGYQPMPGFEDYYLWMRMLGAGKRFANLPEVLVKARAGQEMIRRRQGLGYALEEWQLQKAAYALGFWSDAELVRNIFVRVLPRLLPPSITQKVYNALRKI